MNEKKYPRLVIDLAKIGNNAVKLREFCAERGVSYTPVVKGMSSDTKLIEYLFGLGFDGFATSRISQIKKCSEAGIKAKWMLLRAPMKAEIEDAVRLCDITLQYEISTIAVTEAVCAKLGAIHNIMIMTDEGDLREGFYDDAELFAALEFIRDKCPHIHVKGIGTLFADMSGMSPDEDMLANFARRADEAEKILGYRPELVSGGSTFTLPDLAGGRLPAAINHIRVGETVLLAHDITQTFKVKELDFLEWPTMKIQAEIIELKTKPSVPKGIPGVDAFGNSPVFEDRGMMKRAVLAIGRFDAGDPFQLYPADKNAVIIGATSDHMIVDVTASESEYAVGDVMEFSMQYGGMMYAASSPDVEIEYVK